MTRVDFYGLTEVRPEARERFAVRLLTKAWREGLRSVVLMDDIEGIARMDEALWGESGAFLPHAPIESDVRAPIRMATPATLTEATLIEDAASGLLVNLTDRVPEHFASFERVAEIVCQDDEMRTRARAHYRFYRERGYLLEYHELGGARGR